MFVFHPYYEYFLLRLSVRMTVTSPVSINIMLGLPMQHQSNGRMEASAIDVARLVVCRLAEIVTSFPLLHVFVCPEPISVRIAHRSTVTLIITLYITKCNKFYDRVLQVHQYFNFRNCYKCWERQIQKRSQMPRPLRCWWHHLKACRQWMLSQEVTTQHNFVRGTHHQLSKVRYVACRNRE